MVSCLSGGIELKKYIMIALSMLLLAGCSQPKAFETMSDVYYEPEAPAAGTLTFWLPEDASVTVMENEQSGTIYLCDGYCIMAQTMVAGDLDATFSSVTGYPREKLQIIEREQGNTSRYECVWAAAGEGGDQVGRAVILDDGDYHYALSVIADASIAGELAQVWQGIFDTLSIVP